MAINWSKELAQAYEDLAKNKREIEGSSSTGTPSGKKTDWSRKARKPKGRAS